MLSSSNKCFVAAVEESKWEHVSSYLFHDDCYPKSASVSAGSKALTKRRALIKVEALKKSNTDRTNEGSVCLQVEKEDHFANNLIMAKEETQSVSRRRRKSDSSIDALTSSNLLMTLLDEEHHDRQLEQSPTWNGITMTKRPRKKERRASLPLQLPQAILTSTMAEF